MKNRRVVITEKGGPEVLEVVEEDAPKPEPDEVCVKVIASGVAFGDVLKRRGLMPGLPKMPFTPGYDCLGTVEIKGENISAFHEGDTVAAFVNNGGNAEYVCIKEDLLVKVPQNVDPVEASVIPLNYVTAYQMLHRAAKVKEGGSILIHGAAGGVGTAMLQLCKLAGIKAYGAASAGKHDMVKELGGIPIDYKSEDFAKKIMELTGDGVDAVFDPIGGANLSKSFSVLKKSGSLVGYGMSAAVGAGLWPVVQTFFLLFYYNLMPNGKSASFYGISGSKHSTMTMIKEDMEKLFVMLEDGKIKPIIGAKFNLDDAVTAHEMIEGSKATGKILFVT